jgi:anti-sigma B factor antagonist
MISVEDVDGVCVLKINVVRLDSAVGTVIRNTVISSSETYRKFALDMHEVKLVDSGGLGALVSVLKNVTGQQASLVLVGMQKSVRLMFELSRMDRQFKMVDDVGAALELLK